MISSLKVPFFHFKDLLVKKLGQSRVKYIALSFLYLSYALLNSKMGEKFEKPRISEKSGTKLID